MAFSDDEFNAAAKDAEYPDLDGWEFFVESHGVKIYRLYCSKSQLYEYKVIGVVDIKPELCAAVYMDIDYRKQWDSYVQELAYICKEKPEVIYWEVAYPWPMSHRDYLYMRQMQKRVSNGKDSWIVIARSAKADDLSERQMVDEKKGVIRVTDYRQTMVITEGDGQSSQVYMHYYDDPKGMIPTMIINWAAKTGVPNFMATLEKACANYSKPLTT